MKNDNKNNTGKNKKREIGRKIFHWIPTMATAVLLFFSAALLYQIYMETHFDIYHTTLRFHVRAASDSSWEQELKLAVRDEVLEELKDAADSADSAEELEKEVKKNLKEIAYTASGVLRRNGSGDSVRVSVSKERFPLRCYGSVLFPAGEYKALRVDIGPAKGHNWWCAIYPELCYNSEKSPDLSRKGKEDLERDLSGEEREILCGKEKRFRFKIIEWISDKIQ